VEVGADLAARFRSGERVAAATARLQIDLRSLVGNRRRGDGSFSARTATGKRGGEQPNRQTADEAPPSIHRPEQNRCQSRRRSRNLMRGAGVSATLASRFLV